jgi:medium-chain acyl-[acyl-carrier-protein] hydrolase
VSGPSGATGDAPAGAWLPPRRPGAPAAIRLLALPYAGGDTSIFATWTELLPWEIELWPVQLPGRGRRALEPAYAAVGPLAGALAGPLADAWAAEPGPAPQLAIFGHSMGALVGFELARELRRRGGPAPRHLLVAGRPAPQLLPRYSPLADLPDAELFEQMHRRYGYALPAADGPLDELLEAMRPTVRADLRVSETYVHAEEPPLDCPITAFGGLADPTLTREELDAWRHQTRGPFRTRMLPGGHFFLETEPDVRFLVRFIADALLAPAQTPTPARR